LYSLAQKFFVSYRTKIFEHIAQRHDAIFGYFFFVFTTFFFVALIATTAIPNPKF